MADVYGSVTDVGWIRMDTPHMLEMWWHPRYEGHGNAGLYGARVLPSQPVLAVLTGTQWRVNLVPTIGVSPRMWYELELKYFDGSGTYTRSDWLSHKVTVPPEGGDFTSLPDVPPSPDYIIVGEPDDPPEWMKTGWYWSTDTDNVWRVG